MKNYINCSDRETLENLFNTPEPIRVNKHKVYLILKSILQRIIKSFLDTNDLRVWQTHDKFGINGWHAYDPATGCYTSVESEAEMRSWIEKRYYQ